MKRIFLVLFLAVSMSGCSTLFGDGYQSTVRQVNSSLYPDLPDIEVDEVTLLPVEHDSPRDTSAQMVVNLEKSSCVGDRVRDEAFWIRCGIYPVDFQSNLYRGFDRDNWNNLVINFSRIESQLRTYKRIIEQINSQREEWRQLNKRSSSKAEEVKE